MVVTPWGETRGGIDRALERRGLRRDVALQLPSVLAAPFIIAESDWVMTLPRLAAEALSQAAPIAVHPAPFDIPSYTLKVYSHARHGRSAAHDWLRAQLRACAPLLQD
ncbi:LysR substrate-binding domain-containing protein [Chromobacterium haemolyticum]|uniref:LysR substrate-binding domain-containing protein n=1 Tax=Chromobacterium haemolyticum TaxID=394935 RepID=UPI0023DD3429|nr:LysR substrate-binding domain-containing protein [Chromobacterium haemolyticum]